MSSSPKKADIDERTDMFGAFDEITLRHGGTRIQTISDAYFAACGVESQMATHADSALQIGYETSVRCFR